MARFAIVEKETGKVTNVAEWTPPDEEAVASAMVELNTLQARGRELEQIIETNLRNRWTPPDGHFAVGDPDGTVAIGDTWDGEKFVRAEPE